MPTLNGREVDWGEYNADPSTWNTNRNPDGTVSDGGSNNNDNGGNSGGNSGREESNLALQIALANAAQQAAHQAYLNEKLRLVDMAGVALEKDKLALAAASAAADKAYQTALLGFRDAELKQTGSQWLKDFEQKSAQFEIEIRLKEKDLAQRDTQFKADLELRERESLAGIRQKDEELKGAEARRLDALRAGDSDRAQRETQFIATLQLDRDKLAADSGIAANELAEKVRQFDVTSSGMLNGQSTLAKQKQDTDLALARAEATGNLIDPVTGQSVQTLKGKQQELDEAFRTGTAIGQIGGVDTLEARKFREEQDQARAALMADPRRSIEASFLANGRGGLAGMPAGNQLPPVNAAPTLTAALSDANRMRAQVIDPATGQTRVWGDPQGGSEAPGGTPGLMPPVTNEPGKSFTPGQPNDLGPAPTARPPEWTAYEVAEAQWNARGPGGNGMDINTPRPQRPAGYQPAALDKSGNNQWLNTSAPSPKDYNGAAPGLGTPGGADHYASMSRPDGSKIDYYGTVDGRSGVLAPVGAFSAALLGGKGVANAGSLGTKGGYVETGQLRNAFKDMNNIKVRDWQAGSPTEKAEFAGVTSYATGLSDSDQEAKLASFVPKTRSVSGGLRLAR